MTMTNVSVVKMDEFEQDITQAVKAGYVVFIAGFSGGGKDFIAVKVMKTPQNWVFLDRLGKKIDNSWMVDTKELVSTGLVKRKVFVGIADNLGEVVKTVLASRPVKGVQLYVPQPEPKLYREIMAAKAKGYEKGEDSFKKDWLVKSKWSLSDVRKYFKKKTNEAVLLFRRAIGDVPFKATIVEHVREGRVTHGWEQKTFKHDHFKTAASLSEKEVAHAKQ